MMLKFAIPLVVGSGLALGAPASAQNELRDVISGVAQSLLQQEADRNAYVAAQSANTVAAYRDYLNRYPQGVYRANATQAVATLEAAAAPRPTEPIPAPAPAPAPAASAAATVEAGIGLTRTQRVQIQTSLTKLGYDTRGTDGLWGRNTRTAISGWQAANNQPATGYVTGEQVHLIAQQSAQTTTPGNTSTASDETEERLLDLSAVERREVQLRLTLLGYQTEGTDGVFGQNTRRALTNWQRAQGEKASGYITADQIRALRAQTRG